MDANRRLRYLSRTAVVALLALLACSGCGTTTWSDTKRTATEQLLISDAIDRAVSRIDLKPLSGQSVFLDRAPLKDTVDENYLVSVLRQHMLGSGCILKEKAADADYVVEVRAGAVGTSRHDVLYGIPSTDLPTLAIAPGTPSRIPEIPFAKKTDQQGIAKIALFAYHRPTGMPLWQSGNSRTASTARDVWVLGVGPFEQGTIHTTAESAGDEIRPYQLNRMARSGQLNSDQIWVAQGMQFNSPQGLAWAEQQQKIRLAQQSHPPAGAAHGPKEATAKTESAAGSQREPARVASLPPLTWPDSAGTPGGRSAVDTDDVPWGVIQSVQPVPTIAPGGGRDR